MSKMENETTQNISRSKAKREERRKAASKERLSTLIVRVVGIIVLALVAVGILFLIGQQIYVSSQKIEAASDYSEYSNEIDANGFIKGVNAGNYVSSLVDYSSIRVDYSEIEYTDEEIDAAVQEQLNAHPELSTDRSLTSANGDKINLDYVGSIDGVEFEGGTAEGYDLTLGSGMFIDNFEEQMEGYHPGDQVVVNVTFPEDYSQTDLAGKAAVFNCQLNGIYVPTELDDFFVQTYLSDYADTAEGYRTHLRDTNEASRLENWIDNYLIDNSTVSKYPKAYVKNLQRVEKFNDQYGFQYTNEMYAGYMGYSPYASFEDYVGMTESEYNQSLIETSQEQAKRDLIYQNILEREGVKVTSADYKAYLEAEGRGDSFDSVVVTSGENYATQLYVRLKAREIVGQNVTVVK